MQRIPRNILSSFEAASKKLAIKTKVKGIPVTGIPASIISAYLSLENPAKPGRYRCVFLEEVSADLGYPFTASDWMFNPEKIRQELIRSKAEAA